MNFLRCFRPPHLAAGADDSLDVVLHADRPVRLDHAHGRRIRCIDGCAWLTAAGLREDVFLHGGETWEVVGNGLILIEALGSATVALR